MLESDWLVLHDADALVQHLMCKRLPDDTFTPRARPLASDAQLWDIVAAWYWVDAGVADGRLNGLIPTGYAHAGYGGVVRRCARAAEVAKAERGRPPGYPVPHYPMPAHALMAPFEDWWRGGGENQETTVGQRAARAALRADVVRAVAGNPFRPLRLPAATRTPLTRRLATAAFAERAGHTTCPACRGKGRWLLVAGGRNEGHVTGVCRDCQGVGTVDAGTLDPARLMVLHDALLDAGVPETVPVVTPTPVTVTRTTVGGRGHHWVVTLGGGEVHEVYRTSAATRALAWAEERLGVATWDARRNLVYRGDGLSASPGPHPALARLRSGVPLYRGDWSVACVLDESPDPD